MRYMCLPFKIRCIEMFCANAKKIIHSFGKTDKTQTTFTRFEFERQLNCLRDFVRE